MPGVSPKWHGTSGGLGCLAAFNGRDAVAFAGAGRTGRRPLTLALSTSAEATGVASVGSQPGSSKVERKPRVLSGAQPTGVLHLGNYYGAIKNYVDLQDTHDAFYTIVDLHAITVAHDPKELRQSTRSTAALYVACGVDPGKATIFAQSSVPAHTELSWLLQCETPIGWLERMIQFKEKSRKLQARAAQEAEEAGSEGGEGAQQAAASKAESVSCGLFTYPVLMAADILLYKASLVPVGEDQKQHIELTRDIATRVNSKYGGRKWKKRGGKGGRVLVVPEPFIPPTGARIMSLGDATSKMSKSAESDLSRVNLLDSPKQITDKIKRAKTDAFEGLELGNPERPEANNLLSIYQIATGHSRESVERECGGLRWSEFKPKLADALVASLEPIRVRHAELMSDETGIDEVLRRGAEKANEVAQETVEDVKDAMGFIPRL